MQFLGAMSNGMNVPKAHGIKSLRFGEVYFVVVGTVGRNRNIVLPSSWMTMSYYRRHNLPRTHDRLWTTQATFQRLGSNSIQTLCAFERFHESPQFILNILWPANAYVANDTRKWKGLTGCWPWDRLIKCVIRPLPSTFFCQYAFLVLWLSDRCSLPPNCD